ncbi:hypothetical protein JY651_17100 [Pyxidicoccus parkwayensis]|uniref:Lipoprotein n=1 Tax=Pyxidicoccus parkwayensis TaxID=2813578 RepID=A0ABX7P7W0_9BACT|nr:hypothetical protein [Pyxidicoccus parkwaysis]QSQ26540.1 hypothetical protein JY651_17100 [Pyxidicoccus parkwaysis]
MKTRMRRYLMMSLGAAVLTLVGCFPRGTGPGGGNPGNARFVHMFNCTHVNGPTSPPSGRAFNVWTRVDGGDWIARGGLNPQPGDWTDCHDAAHEASSLKLDLADAPGKWEIWAIMVPRGDEPSCDSSAPNVANACGHLTRFFQTDVTAGTATVDFTDTDGL